MESVIDMAKSLGMEIIAEGVETQQQYHMLSDMGCTCFQDMGCICFQGYYFSRPVLVNAFESLIKNRMALHHTRVN
jgi:EAL domain-containing protein (putative c-di-GMP-specific phosphodiesterase class I)